MLDSKIETSRRVKSYSGHPCLKQQMTRVTAVTRLMSIIVMLITIATWMSTCNDVRVINIERSLYTDLEDRVNVPDGAAALAAADGVVRRVIGAWTLKILLEKIQYIDQDIYLISMIKFRIWRIKLLSPT